MQEQASVVARRMGPVHRTVKKVPFVELLGGRVQGVVSSGSDIQRVYVSFIAAGSGDHYCCTNNNRPCGGLRGAPCKHIQLMVQEAVLQFGATTVAQYLGLNVDADQEPSAHQIMRGLHGNQLKESPGVVFSRFLSYLRYCELEARGGTILEMNWFVS